MWENFNLRTLLVLAAILLLVLTSIGYLKVAYGYAMEEGEEQDEGWFEGGVGLAGVDDVMGGGEKIFDGEVMGKIFIMHKFLDGDILKISVMAEDVMMPVLGLAFHLNYDQQKVEFLKYEPGEFLERGGDPFYLVQNDEKKSEIIFGETLRRNDDFPLGKGALVNLYFQIFEKKAMIFEFGSGVVSTLDVVRQDIDQIVWENLSLDDRGRKITGISNVHVGDNELVDGIDVKVENDSFKFLENSVVILAMGMVIIALGAWILIDRKKRKNYRSVLSI